MTKYTFPAVECLTNMACETYTLASRQAINSSSEANRKV